jgi:hypothetical protein
VAGTQFTISFAVGDWIISSGTAWEKVDLTDAVSSVFGRTGAVVGVSTDYSSVGLTNTAIGASSPSSGAFTSLSSSSTTTLNGTTIPTSSTLLVSGGALGTPSSGTLSSCTGLPISTGVSGLGTGIATALAVNTGSAGAPVLFNGALGTPSSGTVTNLTGTASININGTVGATTASTGAFTTLSATGTITITQTGGGGAPIAITGATTGSTFNSIANSGGTSYWGLESSAGGTFINTSAYAFILGSGSNRSTQIIANATKVADFSSTGLAVTGALSSTTGGNFATSSGSVGIGTASPAAPLHIAFGSAVNDAELRIQQTTNGTASQITLAANNDGGAIYNFIRSVTTSGTEHWRISGGATASTMAFSTNSTERMRIDSSGNVGIGTSSPYAKLNVENGSILVGQNTNTTQTNTLISGYGYRIGAGLIGVASIKSSYNNGSNSASLEFYTDTGSASTERARIDTNGGVRINTTTYIGNSGEILTVNGDGDTSFFRTTNGGGGGTALHVNRSASNGNFLYFTYGTGLTNVGSISYNGTLTVFSTTSDYRLKDITGPLTDSGAFIDSLKPKVGTWKSNGSKFVGFVAHEFAEVCPSAVTGEKDAVDSDGKPVYQAMQAGTAEVIANLVAELQSVRQRLAALEA